LRQETQQQQPQAPQTDGRSVQHPVQQHLPQQDIQIRGLSGQAPSSTNNYTLKDATEAKQSITKLREAVSEEGKMVVIRKMVLNEIKWLLDFIDRSKSYHLSKWHLEAAL
jgi:hypothetical protein